MKLDDWWVICDTTVTIVYLLVIDFSSSSAHFCMFHRAGLLRCIELRQPSRFLMRMETKPTAWTNTHTQEKHRNTDKWTDRQEENSRFWSFCQIFWVQQVMSCRLVIFYDLKTDMFALNPPQIILTVLSTVRHWFLLQRAGLLKPYVLMREFIQCIWHGKQRMKMQSLRIFEQILCSSSGKGWNFASSYVVYRVKYIEYASTTTVKLPLKS